MANGAERLHRDLRIFARQGIRAIKPRLAEGVEGRSLSALSFRLDRLHQSAESATGFGGRLQRHPRDFVVRGSNPDDLRITNDLQHPDRNWDAVGLLLADDLAFSRPNCGLLPPRLIQQVHSRQRNPLSGAWGTNPTPALTSRVVSRGCSPACQAAATRIAACISLPAAGAFSKRDVPSGTSGP